MKKTIFTLLLSLLLQVSFSQGTTLTKGETIAYLQKKLDETTQFKKCDFQKLDILNGEELAKIQTFSNLAISINDNKVTLQYTYRELWKWSKNGIKYEKDQGETQESISFNPSAIKKITQYSIRVPESDIDIVYITLAYECPQKLNGITDQSDLFGFPYYNADPQNGVRIKNAFLHLKDLLKAEGDPFDN